MGGALPRPARGNLTKPLKMRSSISAVFLPLIVYPCSELPRMKAVCTQIVSDKWGLGFHVLPIYRSQDENPCFLCNGLRTSDSQALKTNSAQTRSRFVEFGRDKRRRRCEALPGAARRCDCNINKKSTLFGIVGIPLQ